MTDILGKALIQPEIIPPLHRNQIPEPVMRHLMHNRIPKPNHPLLGDRIPEYIPIIEGNNASILHGPPLVLMREYLIILGEWIRVPEVLLEELHR